MSVLPYVGNLIYSSCEISKKKCLQLYKKLSRWPEGEDIFSGLK